MSVVSQRRRPSELPRLSVFSIGPEQLPRSESALNQCSAERMRPEIAKSLFCCLPCRDTMRNSQSFNTTHFGYWWTQQGKQEIAYSCSPQLSSIKTVPSHTRQVIHIRHFLTIRPSSVLNRPKSDRTASETQICTWYSGSQTDNKGDIKAQPCDDLSTPCIKRVSRPPLERV